jgi:glycosyltransferase involved in cell wall biosynthesis
VEVIAAGPGAASVDGIAIERIDGSGLFYEGGAPDALARGGAQVWARAARFQAVLFAAVVRRLPRWDAVVSHWLAPSAIAAEAARGIEGRRQRHLAIAHSSDVWLLRRSKLGRALIRRLGRAADLVYAAEHLRVAGAPGRVVPMGVDLASLRGDRERGRRRYGLERPCALFLGRLVPIKGVDRLFDALPPGLDLVVAGDGPMRAAWQASAPSGVRFVGEVRGAARADLLAAADLFVLPSHPLPDGRTEGTPTVLLEAMAAGLPIVATRTGGVPDVLTDGRDALLVDAAGPSLRDALARLAADPSLAARLGRNALSAAGAHDWSVVGPRLAGRLLDRLDRPCPHA